MQQVMFSHLERKSGLSLCLSFSCEYSCFTTFSRLQVYSWQLFVGIIYTFLLLAFHLLINWKIFFVVCWWGWYSSTFSRSDSKHLTYHWLFRDTAKINLLRRLIILEVPVKHSSHKYLVTIEKNLSTKLKEWWKNDSYEK